VVRGLSRGDGAAATVEAGKRGDTLRDENPVRDERAVSGGAAGSAEFALRALAGPEVRREEAGEDDWASAASEARSSS